MVATVGSPYELGSGAPVTMTQLSQGNVMRRHEPQQGTTIFQGESVNETPE